MSFLLVLAGIILLLLLIALKFNPAIALLISSIVTGLMLHMPIDKVMTTVNNGIGNTLGGLVMVLSFGAMLGKLVEESGAAQRVVTVLVAAFHVRHIQWAVLLTGLLIGIPLFYNAGFVVLIPLVFAVAKTTRLPLLYVGIPMASALSITHGFLPPHPGPVALATIFKASIGKTLLYGFALAVPIAILAGIVFTRLIIKPSEHSLEDHSLPAEERTAPSTFRSFTIALLPVILIALGTIGFALASNTGLRSVFAFLQDPTISLLVSVLVGLPLLGFPMEKAMTYCVEGVKSIAMIILIIAAGGAFKQVLIDSGIADQIATQATVMHIQPLVLGWLIAALIRVAQGSATIAALTASGMVLPLVKAGVSPELMVLSVGAGSLLGSHVNDTGFWMFKEYFGLNVKQTFRTWTVMESLISILGLAGVLLLHALGV